MRFKSEQPHESVRHRLREWAEWGTVCRGENTNLGERTFVGIIAMISQAWVQQTSPTHGSGKLPDCLLTRFCGFSAFFLVVVCGY